MKIKTDINYQFNSYFFSMPVEIDEKGNVYIKDCYSDKEYVKIRRQILIKSIQSIIQYQRTISL